MNIIFSRDLKKKKALLKFQKLMNIYKPLSEDTKTSFVDFTIYDKVDNKGFSKIVKGLYKLKNLKEYEVQIHFRKKKFRNLHYIKPQFDHLSSHSVGEIQFNKNEMVKILRISSTQINNGEVVIAYSFKFKKYFSFLDLKRYVNKYILELANFQFTPYWINFDFPMTDERQINEMTEKYFFLLFQGFIVKHLYSNLGEEFELPRVTRSVVNEGKDELLKTLKNPFIKRTFTDEKGGYFLVHNLDRYSGITIDEFIFNDSYPYHRDHLNLFTYYQMETYLTFFYGIEIYQLEKFMANYLNSNRKSISSKKYKWLLGKLISIDEIPLQKRLPKDNARHNLKAYSENSQTYFIQNKKLVNAFRKTIAKNLEYLSTVHVTNYNSIILIITIITLILTIIGIVTSAIFI
ncbi:hypothetical protein VNN41_05615 [Lactococcus garvieae]|uniref:hypothetical protein n=1 Tax=Lactococcus garvieae TaxID=1363 RepID=UPI003245CF8F